MTDYIPTDNELLTPIEHKDMIPNRWIVSLTMRGCGTASSAHLTEQDAREYIQERKMMFLDRFVNFKIFPKHERGKQQ